MAAPLSCFLAILLAATTAQALVCYKCDNENTFCGYGLLSFFNPTVECGANGGLLDKALPQQCAKFTATTSDGKTLTARDCVPAVGTTLCNVIAKTAGVFASIQEQENINVDCSLCSEDKCNSASKFTGFSFLAIILASIIFML